MKTESAKPLILTILLHFLFSAAATHASGVDIPYTMPRDAMVSLNVTRPDVIGRAKPATTGQVKTGHLRKGRRLWVRSFLPAVAGRKERPDGRTIGNRDPA